MSFPSKRGKLRAFLWSAGALTLLLCLGLMFSRFGKGDDQALIHAVRQGDVAQAAVLLREGANPNAHMALGRKSLLDNWRDWVRIFQKPQLTPTLSPTPPGYSPKPSLGLTALELAVFNGNTALVKLLLDHGATVHTGHTGSPISSPLISAAADGKAEIVKLLLEHGADPNEGGWMAMSPLRSAISARATPGHLEVIRLLLAHGADPNRSGPGGVSAYTLAGMIAQRYGRTDIEALFKQSVAKPSLHNAVSIGDIEGIKNALQSGATVKALDANGCTALTLAALTGHTEAAALLLDHGADPNQLGKPTPAGMMGIGQMAGTYPLIVAARQGFTDIVKLLLDHGAKIDAQASSLPTRPYPQSVGSTALVAAAAGQHADTAALLLRRGVDLKAAQHQGGRALAAAIFNNRPMRRFPTAGHQLPGPDGKIPSPEETMPILLAHGVDVRADGAEAVVRAAGFSDGRVLRLLLDHGGDPNARNAEGVTALMQARNTGQSENVQLLLKHGAKSDETGQNSPP